MKSEYKKNVGNMVIKGGVTITIVVMLVLGLFLADLVEVFQEEAVVHGKYEALEQVEMAQNSYYEAISNGDQKAFEEQLGRIGKNNDSARLASLWSERAACVQQNNLDGVAEANKQITDLFNSMLRDMRQDNVLEKREEKREYRQEFFSFIALEMVIVVVIMGFTLKMRGNVEDCNKMYKTLEELDGKSTEMVKDVRSMAGKLSVSCEKVAGMLRSDLIEQERKLQEVVKKCARYRRYLRRNSIDEITRKYALEKAMEIGEELEAIVGSKKKVIEKIANEGERMGDAAVRIQKRIKHFKLEG